MSALEGIQAVTLDVGGTLIAPWPSVGHIYSEVAAQQGCPVLDPELLQRRFAHAWRALTGFEHTRAQWANLVDATFAGLVEPPPSQTFFSTLYDRFTEASAWHVFPDVIPALEKLASLGLKLGIISNWDERLRPLLQSLNLHRHFDPIVVSWEVGWSKPAPQIFREAQNQLGVPPSAILHVGDSLDLDFHAARRAGLHARWLRRDVQVTAVGVIHSLAELE